ncbi:uncharacterized protein TNCV_2067011 [Trichonephila clavipes]|uniref:Uncharacterized protein n=1 Tax=Trichonephila clavipes TaxID=2585209 RepID=A0A8X6W2I9_TRICX|nr:uncharacterized protein TNCV_2067011 [Trichonephila clavipes]
MTQGQLYTLHHLSTGRDNSTKGERGYREDVSSELDNVECAPSDDGLERFACPTPDRMGRYRCIDDHMLCDGFIDCAAAEDEDRMSCMFYKTVAKSATISATRQKDEKITKIIGPPLQYLKPVSSANQIPSTSPSIPTVSTSSSSTQAQLLSSASSVTITLSSESQPPIPLTNSTPAMSISLSTPATSSSSTPSVILPSTSDRVENLSVEIQPPVPLLDISPTTSSSQPPISKVVNKNSIRMGKRTKELKPDIEIKMSPHKPNKSYVHYTSEDMDMIVHDVEEDEHFKHIIKTGYSHLITASKYQKK